MSAVTPSPSFPASQIPAVAGRVLRQFAHDRRFLALALIVPLVVIAMLWVFFEAAENPFFDVTSFITPVGAFIVHFLTYVLSAVVLVRERTGHTLARMLVSGYRRATIIAGYILAYSVLATVQSLIVLVETQLLFDLSYSWQTWLLLYLIIWLLAVSSIALGIFVSNFARNEGQVLPFIPLVLMVSVYFSGMIIAVDRLPAWISWLHVVTPMYYATEAIKAVVADELSWQPLALIAYGILVMALAIFTLREREA